MKINQAVKTGLSFGFISAIITTLGLMVGIYATTHSPAVIISAVLVIAVADALSDSLGIHVSVESDKKKTSKQIWQATGATFAAKFLIAATFVIPIFFLSLDLSILISIVWGLFLITVYSYYLAKQNKRTAWKVILEHVGITIAVIALTDLIGNKIENINF